MCLLCKNPLYSTLYQFYYIPILVDSNNNLTDKDGNLILDSNGKPIKVLKDKLGKVTYADSNGNLILDEYGKPIHVITDSEGNILLVNSKGNLTNYKGKTLLDENNKPISLKKHKQSLKAEMLQEQQKIQQELNKNKQTTTKKQQVTHNQTTNKHSNKTAQQNIDMEVLFLDALKAFEEKNPLNEEYGDDDFNVNYANAMGLGNASNVNE